MNNMELDTKQLEKKKEGKKDLSKIELKNQRSSILRK